MQSQLANYRRQIDDALYRFFESADTSAGFKLQGIERHAIDLLREFTLRPGKRIRGALTLFMYENLSGQPADKVMNAAVVQELMQSYLLIVDDVMDRSATRRGKPTIHEMLAAELGNTHENLANMLAINIGLLSQHLGAYLLTNIPEEPDHLNRAATVLHKNLIATVYGQMDDLMNDLDNKASEQDIIRLLERKVSYYSFIGPLQLGATLAGRDTDEVMTELQAIGRPAGLAFQLRDDILGLFGQPDQTGKSASDDIKEGKFTLLMLYTLERADSNDAAIVRQALGNPGASDEAIEQVRHIVTQTGARQAIEAKIHQFSTESKAAIKVASTLDSSAKSFLSDLIDYVTHRKN